MSDLVQLAGYVADDELRTLLHQAGCVVIPSLYEPFGIVALESLAANAPTIVARTGGLAEIMEGTEASLMFEPGNAKELATRIERVLMNPHVSLTPHIGAATLEAQDRIGTELASLINDYANKN